MIQIIGVMVGMYITTRMWETMAKGEGGFITLLLAMLTFLVAVFGMLGLVVMGKSLSGAGLQ